MVETGRDLDGLCVNAIRMLAVDAVEKANSGHPGMPLGAAPMAYVIWTRFLRHNPKNPKWPNRDRFVLSAGHGSALLYSLLHLSGYDLSIDDMKNFRQYGSKTPGHPEYDLTPGVEATTGPLGQGMSMGVGMALAERFTAARYNRPGMELVDNYVYAIVSDGDLMEGVASEAASLAGHQKLGRLIYLYDDNGISIEGSTDLAFGEESLGRFESYGWHVQRVEDGNDLDAIEQAIRRAKDETERPSIISVRTHIGFGSPKQDKASAHGEPLGADAMESTKRNLGWNYKPFEVPGDALKHFRESVDRGARYEADWKETADAYRSDYPEDAARFAAEQAGELPAGWDEAIPTFKPGEKLATRAASGKVLNAIAKTLPNLIGGSADLGPSNKTTLAGEGSCLPNSPTGRNIHFGVREHAMGAIVNGMALYGGVIPYGATFLIFSDYMRPSIRLSALMDCHSIFVFTHDSVGVGEDGPTHQPIEQIASLRAIPDLTTIRPADANETGEALRIAISNRGPVVLALSRQGLPTFDREALHSSGNVEEGAYVLADSEGKPDVILIGTGSEVHTALAAKEELSKKGVSARVVSMPSWEIFEAQPESLRNAVLPPDVRARVAVEAGTSLGWYRWVGLDGRVVSIDRFGTSAPGSVAMDKLGINVENVVIAALDAVGRGS